MYTTQYSMPPVQGYKGGGGVASLTLPEMAQAVESAGRNGDTMLAHITPEEAGILKLLGGSGTINPYTGQPEYFKKFFKSVAKPFQSAAKSIAKAVAPVIRPLAPILPFLPIPGIGPMSALLTKSLLTGIASGLDKSGKFDFNRGLKAGALAYGVGSLMQGANAAGAEGTGAAPVSDVGSLGDLTSVPTPTVVPPTINAPSAYDFGSGDIGMDFGGAGTPSMAPPAPAPVSAAAPASGGFADVGEISGVTSFPGATPVDTRSVLTKGMDAITSAPGRAIDTVSEGIGNIMPQSVKDAYSTVAEYLPSKETIGTIKDVAQIGALGTTAYGAYKTKEELDKQKEEAERIMADQANRTAEEIAFAQKVLADYPIEYRRLTAADVSSKNLAGGGGVVALARGRYLAGSPELEKGDGTSDSIKGSIDGKHPAALATGEFVVDARTVSELGNGSSNAGAKKLYQMMNRVHAERRNAKRGQPSNADQYLPA